MEMKMNFGLLVQGGDAIGRHVITLSDKAIDNTEHFSTFFFKQNGHYRVAVGTTYGSYSREIWKNCETFAKRLEIHSKKIVGTDFRSHERYTDKDGN